MNNTQTIKERLGAHGLRSTRQRLALAKLLFGQGDRHVTAEILYAEARAAGLRLSQATVYNTLNAFHDAGLLREVVVDATRSYFDTNLTDHHHFYVEEEARLIDIDKRSVAIARLPETPQGYETGGVDVIVRLHKRA